MGKAARSAITHPRTGREMKINAAVYKAVRAAIIQSLKGSSGKTFTELSDNVVKIIRKKMPAFTGSIPWYAISVRLDMETRGVVETFTKKGKKRSRLAK